MYNAIDVSLEKTSLVSQKIGQAGCPTRLENQVGSFIHKLFG